MECPICGFIGKFEQYGKNNRDNALCPSCKSLERNRMTYLYLKQIVKDNDTLLYVSKPECMNGKKINDMNVNIISIDIDPNYKYKDYVCDINRLPFEDEKFDVIVCYKVLRQVKNHLDALKELMRVLKPRGKLIMACPISKFTKERNVPKEIYKKNYAPGIIYRDYGLDFIPQLVVLGFKIEIIEIADNDNLNGLLKTEKLISCTKWNETDD